MANAEPTTHCRKENIELCDDAKEQFFQIQNERIIESNSSSGSCFSCGKKSVSNTEFCNDKENNNFFWENMDIVHSYSRLMTMSKDILRTLDNVIRTVSQQEETKIDGSLELQLKVLQEIECKSSLLRLEINAASLEVNEGNNIQSILDTVQPNVDRLNDVMNAMANFMAQKIEAFSEIERAKKEILEWLDQNIQQLQSFLDCSVKEDFEEGISHFKVLENSVKVFRSTKIQKLFVIGRALSEIVCNTDDNPELCFREIHIKNEKVDELMKIIANEMAALLKKKKISLNERMKTLLISFDFIGTPLWNPGNSLMEMEKEMKKLREFQKELHFLRKEANELFFIQILMSNEMEHSIIVKFRNEWKDNELLQTQMTEVLGEKLAILDDVKGNHVKVQNWSTSLSNIASRILNRKSYILENEVVVQQDFDKLQNMEDEMQNFEVKSDELLQKLKEIKKSVIKEKTDIYDLKIEIQYLQFFIKNIQKNIIWLSQDILLYNECDSIPGEKGFLYASFKKQITRISEDILTAETLMQKCHANVSMSETDLPEKMLLVLLRKESERLQVELKVLHEKEFNQMTDQQSSTNQAMIEMVKLFDYLKTMTERPILPLNPINIHQHIEAHENLLEETKKTLNKTHFLCSQAHTCSKLLECLEDILQESWKKKEKYLIDMLNLRELFQNNDLKIFLHNIKPKIVMNFVDCDLDTKRDKYRELKRLYSSISSRQMDLFKLESLYQELLKNLDNEQKIVLNEEWKCLKEEFDYVLKSSRNIKGDMRKHIDLWKIFNDYYKKISTDLLTFIFQRDNPDSKQNLIITVNHVNSELVRLQKVSEKIHRCKNQALILKQQESKTVCQKIDLQVNAIEERYIAIRNSMEHRLVKISDVLSKWNEYETTYDNITERLRLLHARKELVVQHSQFEREVFQHMLDESASLLVTIEQINSTASTVLRYLDSLGERSTFSATQIFNDLSSLTNEHKKFEISVEEHLSVLEEVTTQKGHLRRNILELNHQLSTIELFFESMKESSESLDNLFAEHSAIVARIEKHVMAINTITRQLNTRFCSDILLLLKDETRDFSTFQNTYFSVAEKHKKHFIQCFESRTKYILLREDLEKWCLKIESDVRNLTAIVSFRTYRSLQNIASDIATKDNDVRELEKLHKEFHSQTSETNREINALKMRIRSVSGEVDNILNNSLVWVEFDLMLQQFSERSEDYSQLGKPSTQAFLAQAITFLTCQFDILKEQQNMKDEITKKAFALTEPDQLNCRTCILDELLKTNDDCKRLLLPSEDQTQLLVDVLNKWQCYQQKNDADSNRSPQVFPSEEIRMTLISEKKQDGCSTHPCRYVRDILLVFVTILILFPLVVANISGLGSDIFEYQKNGAPPI